MAYQIFSASRTATVVTLTMEDVVPFKAGDKIVVAGIASGNKYNGNWTVGSVSSDGGTVTYTTTSSTAGTVTYPQNGISITSITRREGYTDQISVGLASDPGLIWIDLANRKYPRGCVISGTKNSKINKTYDGASIELDYLSTTTIYLKIGGQSETWWTNLASSIDLTNAMFYGRNIEGVVDYDYSQGGDVPPNAISTEVFTTTTSETTAVKKLLKFVDNNKLKDAYFQRLLKSNDATKVVGSDSYAPISVTSSASTLRSLLDTVVEIFGSDLKKRRYFVNLSGQLVYEILNDTVPTYATAPYVITTGTATPNSTTVASVNPFNLSVNLDHDTTKRAVFTVSSSASAPMMSRITYTNPSALGTAYTRNGAPILESGIDFPNLASDPVNAITSLSKSYFLERHAPVQSISFELRGAGTAAWNNLGFSAGYYQSGTSTYALQSRWEPGQYVRINAPEMGLGNTLFRVEQVDWSLQPGSYQQIIRITANRRQASLLTQMVGKNK